MKEIKSSLIVYLVLLFMSVSVAFYNFNFSDEWAAQLNQGGSPSSCGDGVCSSDESADSCPVDCFIKPVVKPNKIITGDFDEALRTPDGRVDINLMIERLKGANINTYAFLIWGWPHDYESFLLFLDAANNAGIDVIAYLVPPSEGCQDVSPYGCDFTAWAKDFATLSLSHPNLKGWSIDDFLNHSIYTNPPLNDLPPSEVAGFVYQAYKINPRFAFYPVVYSRYFRLSMLGNYVNYIDGVIFPFYKEETVNGQAVCNYSNSDLKPQIDNFNSLYGSSRNLALLVMVYSSTLCGDDPTPSYVHDTTKIGLDQTLAGNASGVVLYALKKDDTSPGSKYDLIKNLYSQYQPQNNTCGDGTCNGSENCFSCPDDCGVCTLTCTPSWSCTSWSACSTGNTQTRTCTDSNNCNTTASKPAETQGCTGNSGGYASSPSAPSNLIIESKYSGREEDLSWTAPSSLSVAKYIIYRCSGAACSPTTKIAETTALSYSDISLSTDVSYSYAVAAYTADGSYSAMSNQAATTPSNPATVNPNTTNANVPASCVGVTFNRNLVLGSTGQDVKCLQSILNLYNLTKVSTTGAGSPGYETSTLGPRTLSAVRRYQAANKLTPANQVGPLTRGLLNKYLGGG